MAEQALTENTERAFLALLRTALHGGNAVLPDGIDWPALLGLARRHQVFPLILEAAWQNAELPEPLLSSARMMSMNLVMRQAQRTSVFLMLYKSLAEQGLCPLILKGFVCRSLYPDPDSRPSNDEDLLIEPAAFPAVHAALLAQGLSCECEAPTADMHEITYTAPYLRIELHLSLFPADSLAYGDLNALFPSVHERAVDFNADGVTVRTLSPTDHLLYLIGHAFKHFLHSGVGIRQVCDIAVFAEHFKTEIDWARIRRSCDSVRMSGFAAAVFAIASRHLGFAVPAAFADIKTDEGPMLRDMLSGGVYGATEENRIHSSTITLEAVAAQKQQRKNTGALASLFPPLSSMQAKFPYLRRFPWLLPFAWLQRICQYLIRRRGAARVNPAESLRIGQERVALLREYGILD